MISKNISNAIEIISSFIEPRFPVDIESVCEELGIKIIDEYPLDKDGYLICQKGKKIILVNSQVNNRHRKKFIIAHELGHFLLHRDQLYCCDHISDVTQQNINSHVQESEANVFASELLIPQMELKKYIPIAPVKFDNIFDIATTFDVSVTHAAMQAVLASNDESEVLICYYKHSRKWYLSSHKYTYPRMIPEECPVNLPPTTFATNVTGEWTELYSGMVHQEIFCPYGDLYLVLLSGNRR